MVVTPDGDGSKSLGDSKEEGVNRGGFEERREEEEKGREDRESGGSCRMSLGRLAGDLEEFLPD